MDTLYRHWLILRMIPRRRRIATTEIRSRLQSEHGIETTLRTIQRDLIALSGGNFPLECDDNRPSGWSWNKDAPAFDIPNMDPATALTFKFAELYLARMFPQGSLAALRPYMASAEERLKSSESMLARWPDKVRIMSRSLMLLPPAVLPDIAETVYTAVLEEKRFTATYETVHKEVRTHEVNPLGLTFVDGLTYLIASLNKHTDPVLLLLHRIKSAALLDKPVTVPDDFDLDEWVDELLTFAVGDTISLKLRLANKDDAKRLEESRLTTDQIILPMPDGNFELTAEVEDTLQLRWWLQGFGGRIEVLEPTDLRQEFIQLAEQYATLYGKG